MFYFYGMKFGVVVFPGSNCDQDAVDALELMDQSVVKLWHKDHDLQGCDFVILPGGFSYGDYLRTGAVARFSPIMTEVIAHANRGGYVAGFCNGFQILAEAHLVPGVLLRNSNQQYICKNIYLTPQSTDALLTAGLDKSAYKIPMAHGVTNARKNVFAMMPHPERAADPALGNTDGRLILEQMLNAALV